MTNFIDLSVFDDIEIMPVYENKEGGYCEPVLDPSDDITFWTVYGHRKEGGVTALVDCADEHSAAAAGAILEAALLVPDLLEALSFCEATLCDLEASKRKGYIEKACTDARAIIARASNVCGVAQPT